MLYSEFKDEADFRVKFVRPLLNRLGFYGVRETHGSQEFGRDFVFSELHRLGGWRHYAAQVKHEEKINQGVAVEGLLSQIKQAFAKPHKVPESPRECYVSAVYVFNSGEITDNAKEQMLAELGRERYGDNVHFLDGQRLQIVSESVSYQYDRDIRSRLIGLKLQVQANLYILDEYDKWCDGGTMETSGFMWIGIEQFLSMPTDGGAAEKLVNLYDVWHLGHRVENIAKFAGGMMTKEQRAKTLGVAKQIGGRMRPLMQGIISTINEELDRIQPLI